MPAHAPPPAAPPPSPWLALAEALGLIALRKDAEGRYLHLAPAGEALLGLPPGGASGHPDSALLPPDQAHTLALADAQARAQGAVQLQPLSLPGGAQLLTARLPQADGSLLGLWLDRSAQTASAAALHDALAQFAALQAEHDRLSRAAQPRALAQEPVAGLYPAAQFQANLQREIDLSQREHREFALVLMAPDPAPAGQPEAEPAARARIVEALGRLLRSGTRAMDTPGRLDGEGHALLMSGCGLAAAHQRMEGFRRQCAGHLLPHDGADPLRLSLSLGIAAFPHTATEPQALQAAAERALDEARRRGGNQVVLASIPLQG